MCVRRKFWWIAGFKLCYLKYKQTNKQTIFHLVQWLLTAYFFTPPVSLSAIWTCGCVHFLLVWQNLQLNASHFPALWHWPNTFFPLQLLIWMEQLLCGSDAIWIPFPTVFQRDRGQRCCFDGRWWCWPQFHLSGHMTLHCTAVSDTFYQVILDRLAKFSIKFTTINT